MVGREYQRYWIEEVRRVQVGNKTKDKTLGQGGGDILCFQRPWALLDLS